MRDCEKLRDPHGPYHRDKSDSYNITHNLSVLKELTYWIFGSMKQRERLNRAGNKRQK